MRADQHLLSQAASPMPAAFPIRRRRGRPRKRPLAEPKLPPHISVGTLVHVNNRHAVVESVEFDIEHFIKEENRTVKVPLRSPLYVLRLDLSRLRPWVVDAPQIYIPAGATHLKLFADEFELVPVW